MGDEVIEGFSHFEEQLKKLELSQQRELLVEAARAGAKIAQEALQSAAPRRTGQMATGLAVRASAKNTDANEATVDVKPSKKGWYWFFTNTGTKNLRGTNWADNAVTSNRERILKAIREKMLLSIQKAIQ